MRKVDWKAYCRNHGIQMNGKPRRGLWLEVRCPFCSDKGLHGAVNVKSGAYNCWKCGGHSMTEFVSITSNTPNDFRDVAKYLEPWYTDADIYATRKVDDDTEHSIKIEKTIRMPGTSPLGAAMKQYLRSRGFSPKYMEKMYGLKDGGIAGRWAWRLMIPVNIDGKLVAWQGRTIGKDNPLRYMASSLDESAMDIKDVVYNLDYVRGGKAILVEGVFDSWKIGPGSVALFGISLKDSQIQLLASRLEEAYILFDPEPKAQEQASVLARKLANLGVKATVLNMEDTESEDPGDLTADEVRQLRTLVFGKESLYDEDTPWLI